MSYLDIILSVPLMWGLYKGLSKGIIKELAALTALIAGIYGAIHLADNIHPYLKEQFAITSSFLPIVSFAITFIIIEKTYIHYRGELKNFEAEFRIELN